MNYGTEKKKLKGLADMATKSAKVPSAKSATSGKLKGLKDAARKDLPKLKSATSGKLKGLKDAKSTKKLEGLKSAAAKAKLKSKLSKKKEDYNAVSGKGIKFTYDPKKYKTPQAQAEALDKKLPGLKERVKQMKLKKFNKVKNGTK